MECPSCQRSITIPEGGVNDIPQNLHLGFEVEVARYMSRIGCDDEKSCDACIDGGMGPAVVFCCTCHQLLCKLCHDYHKRNKILQHHQIVELGKDSLELLPFTIKPAERLCSLPQHDKVLKFYYVASKLTRAIIANDKEAEQVQTSRANITLIITQAFEQLRQTIEDRKKALLSEMEAISVFKTTSLTLQNEQLKKMQDEIGRYTEMTTRILQTHTDHEIIVLRDLLPIELKATLKKVENMSLTPDQSSDIHVFLHTATLIKDLSIFGHVMDSSPSPSQSTWSSESVVKVKEKYCVKVVTMTSKGERYPYGGLQVKAELSRDGAVVPGDVEDHGDGTYAITLNPIIAGPHQLLITMDGQHVQKSPCDLHVRMNYSILCNPEQVINCSGGPSGIAIHDSGDIYVACIDDSCIHVFDQVGQQKKTIGSKGSGDGQFSGPRGLFIKGDVMYVADTGNNHIQKLTTEGQFLQKFGSLGSAFISSLCSSGFGLQSSHHLSQAIETFNSLVSPADAVSVESLLTSSISQKYLSVVPSENLGLHLDPPVFQVVHLITLATMQLPARVKVEVGNNLSRDHSKTRPADILLPNWFLGRTAALDVSITSPLNPVTLLEAGVSATTAAQATEARKHQANDPKCSELGWVCIPMVVETYGAWGKEATAIISSVASSLATSTCRPKSTILHEIILF
eukprot:Em0004g1442a